MNFKDYFAWNLVDDLSYRMLSINNTFDCQLFKENISPNLLSLEMKERVVNISTSLYFSINKPYPETVRLLLALLSTKGIKDGNKLKGFPVWVISDIVERYGLEHPNVSIQAIYTITQSFTGEFAIRPYLELYPKLTLNYLHQWALDSSPDVRRLVSEGTRSRLPWAKKVDWLVNEPWEIFHLLDKLYNDDSEYVKRSVANNLNDMSKKYPEEVVNYLKRCSQENNDIDWLIRHSCRSMIKNFYKGALELQGHSTSPEIEIETFEVTPSIVTLGSEFQVNLTIYIISKTNEALLIDLELCSAGVKERKRKRILKWCRREGKFKERITITKSWSLKDTATRREMKGDRLINLMINGKNFAADNFQVI